MKRLMAAALLMLLSVCIGGCGDDLTSKVIGIWHFQEKSILSGTMDDHFLEIGKNQIVQSDGMPSGTMLESKKDTVLDVKDGMVIARMAGHDRVLHVIKIIDDNTIEVTYPMLYGKQTLTRSSEAARNEAREKAAAKKSNR